MSHRRALALVARLALLVLTPLAPLFAQTSVIDDAFADGNRTGQTPPASVNWFLNSGSGLTNSTVAGSFQFNNTASRLLIGYLTAAGSPVSVTTGQTLTLELSFSASVTPASVTNGFNLALFNSASSRVAADFSGTSNAAFAAYDGYGVKTSGLGSTAGSNVTLRQRNAGTSTAPMSTSGDWNTLATASGTTTAAAANVNYVATLAITNNGATVGLSYSVKTADGVTTLQSLTGTDSSTLVTNFDTFALYAQTAEFPSGNLVINRVKITLSGGSGPVAPSITTHPASQTVTAGTNVTFTVVASGTAPLSYQWAKNTVAIPGATGTSLTLSGVQAGDAASYTVTVTNAVSSVTSNPATLTVNAPVAPAITTQPASQTINAGSPVTFGVVATGTAPLSYQWSKDGNNIGGATGSSYTIASVQAGDAGSYRVTVTNAGGSTPSDPAVLTVNVAPVAPVVTTPPASQSVNVGSNVTFNVTATGTAPLTYEWQKDLVPIPGATGASLTLSNVQLGDAGSYRVVVSNAAGSAPSAAATLTVTSVAGSYAQYNLTGFATQGGGTTGGGVIPESDPAYVKVFDALGFVNAVILANKTTNAVKVIEIMNDLNLGWLEVGSTVQNLASNALRAHATPKLHPVLLVTGMSVLDIKPKNGITIFSANGSTIKHCNFNIKGATNIILRNLKFDENWEWDEASKGNYDSNDWDFITLSNGGAATNIWIDHCTFTKSYDGIADMKAGTQYVTLSWCKYVGDDGATNPNSFVRQQINALEANRASYTFYNFLRTNGFSVEDIVQIIQGHDKTHLMGSNSLDTDNNTLSATFHHLWFDSMWDRCVPRLRGGNVHNYNIYVDDTNVLAAKRLRDARAALLTTALRNTLNNTYSFNPPINGSISTENGAVLLEKSIYLDCLWPLRNNQTDPTNAVYTGKIMATDSIYTFHNADGTITTVRGNSTDAGNPMGPFQAAIIPFAWNLPGNVLPYAYPTDDPAQLPTILADGAGAGRLTWPKQNWLMTTYASAPAAPTIVTSPVSQSGTVGGSVTFTVTVDGTAPLTYQWTKDNSAIGGATLPTLTLSNLQLSDAGTYAVTVTNALGFATSSGAVLTVSAALTPPSISVPPAAQTVNVGTNVTFSVTASGSSPLSYQWTKDGNAISGATGSSLSLASVQASDAGSYAVVVTNPVTSVTSAAAALVVITPSTAPTILAGPAGQTAFVGGSATFTVLASGTAPLNYLWQRSGVGIAAPNAASITLNNLQAGDAGDYTVVVSNAGGSATSTAAPLAVLPPVAGDLFVAPTGLAANPGTLLSPTTLESAITRIAPGNTIWVRGGTYNYAVGITVAKGNNGSAGARTKIFAYNGEIPVYDFSGQAVLSTNRGLTFNGNYWHVKGLVVLRAGDNGIYIGGNHNIVELCRTAYCGDSGLQLGRISSSDANMAQWPANNLILNCESHDNSDPSHENADGFACKLTTGPGNIFRGCIAHHNSDDGWDLFTKTETGPIGSVTLDQCVAYNNGTLSDGSSSSSGDKNGFKLGGEDIAVIHVVTRCLAFNNGKNGFTWNSNPGAIRMINNFAFNNTQGNYKFDQAGPVFYNNVSLWTSGNGVNDRYGGNSGIATGPSNCFWFASGTPKSRNDQGIQVSAASFVSLTVPPAGFARRADGSIDLGNFARPVSGSPLINAGTLPPAAIVAELSYVPAAYYEDAPDIGLVESYLHAAPSLLTAPVGATITSGGSATFSVVAGGTAPFSYQWSKDGSSIGGATSDTLALNAVTTAAAGNYVVTITNAFGSVASTPVALVVNKIPASVALGNLSPVYDGTPKSASVTTVPANLAYAVTYEGSLTPPTNAGSYAVVATINDLDYSGTAQGTLAIARAPQSITFGPLANATYGDAPIVLGATSSAGLSITYIVVSGPANVVGSTLTLTGAGSVVVRATQDGNGNYEGAAPVERSFSVARAAATAVLGDLAQSYNGLPRAVSTVTTPANLAVGFTYNGSPTPPVYPGTYLVAGTVTDPNYTGSASGTLVIAATARVRHLTLNSDVDGSVQLMTPENTTLSNGSSISGDLLVPGLPSVSLSPTALFVGTQDGPGSDSPSSYQVTLNGDAVLRYLVRRIDPIALATVAAPPAAAGTRVVSLNAAGQSAGDFATLKNLTLSGNAGAVAVPPGTYGSFTVSGNSALVLGVAGSSVPAVYNLQSLAVNTLPGNGQVQVVGPVVLTLASGTIVNGAAGSAAHPEWLTIRVASGGLTSTGSVSVNASVVAPNGTVTLNGAAVLNGTVVADRLTLNGTSLLNDPSL